MASEEVAAAIAGGMSMELVDALMVALGSRFKSISGEFMQAIGDMYTTSPSTGLIDNALKGKTTMSPGPAEQGTLPYLLI